MGRMAAHFAVDLLNKKTEGGYVNVPDGNRHQGQRRRRSCTTRTDLFPKPSKAY